MNLAITLLVAIAIASVVGTVVQQNEPYTNYLIQFGPFWFEFFKMLGIYDLYGAGWYLLMVSFLVLSTTVCVYRHTPIMLREMRSLRLKVKKRSLLAFHYKQEWNSKQPRTALEKTITTQLEENGYQVGQQHATEHSIIGAKRGTINRLGYLLTHVGLIVICGGALVDSTLALKLQELSGSLQVEMRDIDIAQVPPESRLGIDNPAFRGRTLIPEESRRNNVLIQRGDGFLVQELPFQVGLKAFRVEYYNSGQPKSFESDLLIYDPRLSTPLLQTISVNHPLSYRGFTLYQTDFQDGGSKLQLTAWPLSPALSKPQKFAQHVYEDRPLLALERPLQLELTDLRPYNINPTGVDGGFADSGPSFRFKLRQPSGAALEFENYMRPIERNGQQFLLSGVRASPNEEFFYLHIPTDEHGSSKRFMALRSALFQPEALQKASLATAVASLREAGHSDESVADKLAALIVQLAIHFRQGGFEAVAEWVEKSVPAERRNQVGEYYATLLNGVLRSLYLQVLHEEGAEPQGEAAITAAEQFFESAITALDAGLRFGSPYYFELTDFELRQATLLQITRAPGQNVVYLGCLMLIAGIFLLFYVPQRRLWVWLEESQGETTRIIFAGTSNRNPLDFNHEFAALSRSLEKRIQ